MDVLSGGIPPLLQSLQAGVTILWLALTYRQSWSCRRIIVADCTDGMGESASTHRKEADFVATGQTKLSMSINDLCRAVWVVFPSNLCSRIRAIVATVFDTMRVSIRADPDLGGAISKAVTGIKAAGSLTRLRRTHTAFVASSADSTPRHLV